MKHNALIFGALLLSTPFASTHAVELTQDLSVQIETTLASDYRSRGISQTQNDPAIQAGATLQHSSGLYLGVWSSNVDFGYGLKTRQELDYYAGWYWQATEDVGLDLGYIQYRYPKESQFDQSEVYAVLNAYGFEVGAYYSDDLPTYFGRNQSNLYSYVGYGFDLPAEFRAKLRLGRNDAKDPLYVSGDGDTRHTYQEWEARLDRDFAGIDWSVSYIDTDLSQNECYNWQGFKDVCTATVVARATKQF